MELTNLCVCDTAAALSSQPGKVVDILEAAKPEDAAAESCIFATHLRAPCVAADAAEKPDNTLVVVLSFVGAFVGLVAIVAAIVVTKKQELCCFSPPKRDFSDVSDSLLENDHMGDFGT